MYRRHHESPPLDPVVIKYNQIHNFTIHLYKINFSIIHPFPSTFPNDLFELAPPIQMLHDTCFSFQVQAIHLHTSLSFYHPHSTR